MYRKEESLERKEGKQDGKVLVTKEDIKSMFRKEGR